MLQRISVQLDALSVQVAATLERRQRLSRNDRKALAALLPAIADSKLATLVFTSREAIEHVRDLPRVVSALCPVVGSLEDGGAPRGLGRLLARAENQSVDGHQVIRHGEERDGVVWAVVRV